MIRHSPFARTALTGALAVLVASTALSGPAAAQSTDRGAPPSGRYYQDCHRDRTGSTIFGALVGAGIGALLGNAVAANGHRGDGAALGAGLGGVTGGVLGSTSARCSYSPPPRAYSYDGAPGYADQRYGYYDTPPPPPPPYDNGGGRGPGYTDQGDGYQEGPPPPPGYYDRDPGAPGGYSDDGAYPR